MAQYLKPTFLLINSSCVDNSKTHCELKQTEVYLVHLVDTQSHTSDASETDGPHPRVTNDINNRPQCQ